MTNDWRSQPDLRTPPRLLDVLAELRRLTIWGKKTGVWKALFHQGTVVA
jgi:hypothetical protein